MKLHNYMEDIVVNIMNNLLINRDDVCKCKKCLTDITALALNRLPSKYIVTPKGRVHTKLAELEAQLRADIVKEITKAIKIVKQNPQH